MLRRKFASVSAFSGLALQVISGNLDRIISQQAYCQYSVFAALAGAVLLFAAVMALREKQ